MGVLIQLMTIQLIRAIIELICAEHDPTRETYPPIVQVMMEYNTLYEKHTNGKCCSSYSHAKKLYFVISKHNFDSIGNFFLGGGLIYGPAKIVFFTVV